MLAVPVATSRAAVEALQSSRRRAIVMAAEVCRSRAGALVVACVLIVLAFYARSAASYGKPLAPDQPQLNGNFQNPIADALLGHQLSLKVKPQEGLLRLPDPYDPIANFPYRAQGIHDYSLYKGKLYAYFGPAPALLLYIPFRLLRVGDLSPAIATLVFAALGFLFSVAFFRVLVRWWWKTIPVWMQCVAVVTLGAAVPVAWLVHIGQRLRVLDRLRIHAPVCRALLPRASASSRDQAFSSSRWGAPRSGLRSRHARR